MAGTDRLPLAGSESVADDFLQVDLAAMNVDAPIERFVAGLDHLAAVVNNAALQVRKPMMELSLDEWDASFAVNIRSAFIVSRAAVPHLAEAGGAIVNIASVHALATTNGFAAYAATKGALLALTRSMALELAPRGIRVNAVLPGAVDTPMLRSGLAEAPSPQEEFERLSRNAPMGRIGTPEEIGRVTLFLADGASASFVTGQALVVDGGALARLSTQ